MLHSVVACLGALASSPHGLRVRQCMLALALVPVAARCGPSDRSGQGDDANGEGGSGAVAPEPGTGGSGMPSSGGDDFGFGEPVMLANDLDFPTRLATSSGEVYVGVRGALGLTGSVLEGSGGAVLRAALSGVTTIATGLPGVTGIAATEAAVYWLEVGPPARVVVKEEGTEARTFSDDVVNPSAIAAVENDLWVWDHLSADVGLRLIDPAGSTLESYPAYVPAGDLVVATDTEPVVALAAGYESGDSAEPSAFFTLPEPGPAETLHRIPFAEFVGLEDGVVLGGEDLVYSLSNEGTLNRAPISSLVEERVVLAGDLESPWGVATDGVYIYFTERAGEPDWECQDARGRLNAIPVSGGAVEVLADGLMCPSRIEVNDDGIYWVNNGVEGESNGALMVVPKVPSGEP